MRLSRLGQVRRMPGCRIAHVRSPARYKWRRTDRIARERPTLIAPLRDGALRLASSEQLAGSGNMVGHQVRLYSGLYPVRDIKRPLDAWRPMPNG